MAWKRSLLAAAILVMGLVLVSGKGKTQSALNDERFAMREIGKSNFEFSKSLYKELAKTPGNIFFSPLSIHSILTMLSLGAKENSLAQLKEGLVLPEAEKAKIGYRVLNKNLRFLADKGVTVNIANKVYATTRAPLSSAFQQMTKDYFNAVAENVNFAYSESARQNINRWVENATNKKILNVVPPGTLSADTAMVLVNAVYFKGRWLTEFDPANTTSGQFHGVNGDETVKFMETTSEFAYRASDKLKSKIVELPYNGDQLSLVIILPYERDGFDAMEKALATTQAREYLPGQNDKYDVRVKIPRFRLEKETPLVTALEQLNITDIFTSSADLGGLTNGSAPLKVSKILHKAFIEVNEEGSEAAATTVMVVQTLSLNNDDNRPFDFIADQPFIFMIRHKLSNSILFMGRYVSASDNEGVQPSRPSNSGRNTAPNQNRQQGGSQGHQAGHGGLQGGEQNSGRLGQRSRVKENQGVNQQHVNQPDNLLAVRNGAGQTSNGNIQYGNQQENYDFKK